MPDMHRVDNLTTYTQALALLGLESALTSALAHAQLAGDPDVCDRLLALKRDTVARRRHFEQRLLIDPLAA